MRKDVLEKWLVVRLAEEIGIEPSRIDAKAPLYVYLMNGFQSFGVVADLEKLLKRKLSPSILYEQPSIAALAEQLTYGGKGNPNDCLFNPKFEIQF
jgi:hypothetical protein